MSGTLSAPVPRSWVGRVGQGLGLQPVEQRGAFLLLAHSFAMGTATVFFETAASSLFLARFGSAWLPYVYVAAAVVNTLAGLGYSALQARTSFRRLMMAT